MIQLIRFRLTVVTVMLSLFFSFGAYAGMGTVKNCKLSKGKLIVTTQNGKIEIEPYSSEIIKVTPTLNGCKLKPKASASVAMTPGKTTSGLSKREGGYVATFGNIKVEVNSANGRLSFSDGSRQLLSCADLDSRGQFSFANDPAQALYGAGERGVGVDLQGDTLIMFNKQNYAYGKGDRTSQMNITMPYIASSKGYALFFDDYSSSKMILGEKLQYITEIENPVSYFFILSSDGSLASLVDNFTLLTGRQELAPFWSLGYITSKYGYKTQEETAEVVNRLKREGYPLDGVVLDLYWYGQETDMGRFEWNPAQWPDHKAMLADFNKKGVKTIIISQPYLNKIGAIDNYNMAKEAGMLTVDSLGNTHDVTTWVGEAGMLDVSNPATCQWLWSRYKALTEEGVGGWWGDLGEPEVHPLSIRHHNGETAAQYHNRYGNDWSRIIYDGFKKDFPNTRLMTLMRGGTAGLQHYSVFPWSTDVSRSWAGLQAQVPIMINSALSGLGYMSHDVGGFAVDPANPVDPELYIRWVQLGLFTPTFRTHSTVEAEPYNYTAPGYQKTLLDIVKARYQWLPYNYTLAYENALCGAPFVRPMNFHNTAESLFTDVQDQYFWGKDILVAPVLEKGAIARKITLPEGKWYDLNSASNEALDGGRTICYRAPLDCLPLFAREGAIVPKAKYEMQNTGDYNPAKLTVEYYLGSKQSSYTLFDDDRTSTGTIERGEYRLVQFSAVHEAGVVKFCISESGKGYAGVPAVREVTLEVRGLEKAPEVVEIAGKRCDTWTYDKAKRMLMVHFRYSSATSLTIK